MELVTARGLLIEGLSFAILALGFLGLNIDQYPAHFEDVPDGLHSLLIFSVVVLGEPSAETLSLNVLQALIVDVFGLGVLGLLPLLG